MMQEVCDGEGMCGPKVCNLGGSGGMLPREILISARFETATPRILGEQFFKNYLFPVWK